MTNRPLTENSTITTTNHHSLKAELTEVKAEWQQLNQNQSRILAELADARQESDRMAVKLKYAEKDRDLLIEQGRRDGRQIQQLHNVQNYLLHQLEEQRCKYQTIKQSGWWRAMKPLRWLSRHLLPLHNDERIGTPNSSHVSAQCADEPLTSAKESRSTTPNATITAQLVGVKQYCHRETNIIAFYQSRFAPDPSTPGQESPLSFKPRETKTDRSLLPTASEVVRSAQGPNDALAPIATLARHAELAQIYGIRAFCFPYQWNIGQISSDQLLASHFLHSTIDFDFCICCNADCRSHVYSSSEALVTRANADPDDFALLALMAAYFHDRRYVRVDGRPLLLARHFVTAQDAEARIERWRGWCRSNGIGEIFLAFIHFPEDLSTPCDAVDATISFNADYVAGPIGYVGLSEHEQRGGQWRIPGVCLDWDKTPRTDLFTTGGACSPPRFYRDRLERAIIGGKGRRGAHKLVFIDGWNNDGTSLDLEPTQRYGYAYLEATRQAQDLAARRMEPPMDQAAKVGIVMHAFYPEILEEVLPTVGELDFSYTLFVTCPLSTFSEVTRLVCGAALKGTVRIQPVANRGRDVAPFLAMLPQVEAENCRIVLKLHTKKSPHRCDGDRWRKDIYSKLLAPDWARAATTALRASSGYGIVGPEGSVVSMRLYEGANIDRVRALSHDMGVAGLEESCESFVAGSMFYCRLEAMRPLRRLCIDMSDFEPETGQIDGTLAHVIERAFSYSALAAGYRVGEVAMTAEGLIVRAAV